MRLSRRALGLAESATMRVHRRATELRAAGRDLVDFSAGLPDFPSPPAAVEAARRALLDGHTRYTAAAGLPDLRLALARRYGRDFGAPWGPDGAVVTVGAKAALYQLAQVLVDDGDEAVLPSPAWVSFEEQIRLAGGRPVLVPMSADDGFRIHAEPLISALGDRTRLVVVNSPCNPTGGRITEGDLRLLAEACASRGIVLLCDETYERFVYGDAVHASGAALAVDLPDTVVVVGSFSKTWSMTGWRLGWALGPVPLISKVIELQSHTTSNPTSFAMHGALAALEHGEPHVAAMRAELAVRRDLVTAALAKMPGVQCAPPGGAFYAFPHVADHFGPGRRDSVELAEHLLETAGVAVVPGVAFGAPDHLRLSFTCGTSDVERGMDRLTRAFGG
ncbi:MAG: pyridoxal phosphate-dependent aminotransferase [Acidobacteriota bacterium]